MFVVFITAPNLKTARDLAKALVGQRLASCVNISSPVESHYRWEGKRQKAKEYLLIVKTPTRRFEALKAEVKKLHPYEVPEIIALPVEAGYEPYLQWIEESVSPDAG